MVHIGRKFIVELCTIIGVLFSFSLSAQEIPQIYKFSKTDYPGSNQNWSIAEDSDGKIYVANNEGITVFNGYNWGIIEVENSPIVRSLFTASDSSIYYGAYETFGRIVQDNQGEVIAQNLSDKTKNEALSNQEIWQIFELDNDLFFQSFSSIYKLDSDNTVEYISPPSNIMFANVFQRKAIIPAIETELYEFDGQYFSKLGTGGGLPSRTKVSGIVQEGASSWIIGTQFKGLYRFDGERYIAIDNKISTILKRDQLNKLIKLESGLFVCGTIIGGLYILDENLNVRYHISKLNGLENNTILSVYEDSNNNLWIGMDRGVNVILLGSDDRYYYDNDGLLGTIYTAAYFQNDFYLGTNQGLFKQRSDGSFDLVENSQGQVWKLTVKKGKLFCAHNKGIFVLDQNQRFHLIFEETGVWDIQAWKEDKLLAASYTGLVVIDLWRGYTIERPRNSSRVLLSKMKVNGDELIGIHPQRGIGYFKILEDELKDISYDRFAEWTDHKFLELKHYDDKLFFYANSGVFVSDLQLRKLDSTSLNTDDLSLDMDQFLIEGSSKDDYMSPNLFGYSRPSASTKTHHGLEIPYVDLVIVNGRIFGLNSNNKLPNDVYQLTIQLGSKAGINSRLNIEYRLEGHDNLWYKIPENGLLNFKNLDDGAFNLEVKNKMDDQLVLLHTFVVPPHWYESSAAYVGYVLCTLLLVYYFFGQHKKRLERIELQLKEEQEEELRRQNVANENKQLQQELMYKSKMLANSAMTMIQKSNLLLDLKEQLAKARMSGNDRDFQRINRLIERNLKTEADWNLFEQNFSDVHSTFMEDLQKKHEEINYNEIRLCTYIRMDLSSKEIGPLLNISTRSVENKRYKLRKKLGLKGEESLKGYLMRL